MLYSHVALLMLRVFSLVQEAGMSFSASLAARMRTAHIDGDVQLGCLFPIHRKVPGIDSCGEIWEQYGIHRTEVALETVRQINLDPTILPGITLGIDVRDSCWTERIAMEQTIAFIRDALGQGTNAACCSGANSNDPACKTQATNLAAVIGPGSSATTIAVQNLLQVFRIPQIGYSATTKDLSDKTEFKYFMRLVPSDSWQAKALVEIVRRFGWSYVAVVYSDGNYGEKGFEELQHYIEQQDEICIAVAEKIKSLATEEEYDMLLNTISSHSPRPKVVICFCEGETIHRAFQAIKRYKESHCDRINNRIDRNCNATQFDFQWIGSESWSDRADVVSGVEEFANGSISLRIFAPWVPWFDKYYFGLVPEKNTRNPWFTEFWEQKFGCRLEEPSEEEKEKFGGIRKMEKCTGDENLTQNYEQDPKVSQVISSVYTVAYGLDHMYQSICGDRPQGGLCPAMLPLNGTQLLEYMMNVSFVDKLGQEIVFDKNGDPLARYDVLNYQANVDYVKVGEYYKGALNLSQSRVKWAKWEGNINIVPISVCSMPCGLGEIKKIQTSLCCWHCIPCEDNQIRADLQTCQNCSLGFWPDRNKTECFKLEILYIRWIDPAAILAVGFACFGIVTTLFVICVFLRYNSTPVVKATTRELSYIILVGIVLCYGITFGIIAPPTSITCFIVRTLPGLAFAMIYGALLTKTNRIARILAGSKKRILTKKPRFLSTASQVIITWLLVAVELAIVTAAVIVEWPEAAYDQDKLPREMRLICQTSTRAFLAPYGWDLFLIMMCTLYAVKTRNLPENFNEAKFIGFTMYTTCIIWLAFITIYFGSPNKALTMCLSFSLCASVTLVLLFIPKVYIILIQPHKNVRSSYATTKVIRCHFGPPSTAGGGTTHQEKVSRTGVSSGSGDSMNEARNRKQSSPAGRLDSVHVPKQAARSYSTGNRNIPPHDLSVIEESQQSADDITSTAASKTSRSELVSLVTQPSARPLVRQVECQTDEWLLREFLNAPTTLEDFLKNGASSPRPSSSGNGKFRAPKRALSEYPSKSRELKDNRNRRDHSKSSPDRPSGRDEEFLRLLDRPSMLPVSDSEEEENKSYYAFKNLIEEPSENAHEASNEFIADRFSHTVETLVSPATTLAQVELKTSPQELVKAPRFDRQESVLTRLGYSIKKRIRRNSAGKLGKVGDNGAFEMDRSPPKTTLPTLSAVVDTQSVSEQTKTVAVHSFPRSSSKQDQSEVDSGIMIIQQTSSLDKTVSIDSSGCGLSKSSKHSSLSSKQSSAKSKMSNDPEHRTTLSPSLSVTAEVKTNDNQEIKELFLEKGLEATYLSESTLV